MNRTTPAAIIICLLLTAPAWGVPAGKTLEWKTSQGTVVFKGDDHAGKGMKCAECHTKIFRMKKDAAEMKMADINAGKFCGECHNGTKAFTTSDPKNCSKCHKK